MKKLLICGLAVTIFMSCGNSKKKNTTSLSSFEKPKGLFTDLDKQARSLFKALPNSSDKVNATSEEIAKVALGKMLYFDKRLSKDNKQSCNTCHGLNTYGVDNKPFSEGNDGELGDRNSPTTFNAFLHIAQFWDGRESDVEAQAGKPILNPVEMAMPNEEAVVKKIANIQEYITLFQQAFPKQQPAITYINLTQAIGAFERKLVTPSKFDDYILGDDDALNEKEKKGLQTYMNAGCFACHKGSLLGGDMYQKFGVYGNYWEHTKSKKIDEGRFNITKNESDKYVFKVPSLRNVEKTSPYLHDGSVSDLKDVIKIMGAVQLNKDLSNTEIDDIITFLKTLTGDISKELKTHDNTQNL